MPTDQTEFESRLALAHLSDVFRRMLVRLALAGSRTKSSLLRVALCGLCWSTGLGGGPMTAPALAEPRAVTKIAPNDTVELSVTGWAALKGGVAEATLLNDSFTVGRTGTLKLPFVGTLPAAGLTPAELERRIADRLQERSGLKDRAGAHVKLSEKPEAIRKERRGGADWGGHSLHFIKTG